LGKKLEILEKSGLDTLTVSMHAFNRDRYKAITRVDGFDRVKETIEVASKMNFKTIKVNRVLINEDGLWEDLMAFFDWAAKFNIRIKLYKLIWSPNMEEKRYFESYVPWKALILYLKNNGSIVETNKYLVSGRERLVWKMKSGLEIETDVFSHKLEEGTGKVCQKCPMAPFCLEGLMSYGVEVNSELSMAGCLLRDDLGADLWDETKARDENAVKAKVQTFLKEIV
jgi:molybdenum cofactor biosynthesis enzyme MoaA